MIFVPTTTTTDIQTNYFTPAAHAHRVLKPILIFRGGGAAVCSLLHMCNVHTCTFLRIFPQEGEVVDSVRGCVLISHVSKWAVGFLFECKHLEHMQLTLIQYNVEVIICLSASILNLCN